MSHHGADAAPRFNLGRVFVTSGARAVLSNDEIDFALTRHRGGDWGDLEPEDEARNDVALLSEGRIVSAYCSTGTRFYIITESDRSITTVLLPHEY
jgi:hypothetical protein